MSKRMTDNLRIKRKYLVWLKDARGLSEASIDKAAAAISTYEDFLNGKDVRAFHSERARSFKRHLALRKNKHTGTKIAQGSINGVLREVKAYFVWLADQPGYKSRITFSGADYLSPDRKSEAARRSSCWKPHPSPDQIRHLLQSMPTDTVLHRRDRALIAFLFLTGSREGAAITLRIGHVDLPNACVHFDGKTVNTKFGKTFTTAFFPMGDAVEQIVRNLRRTTSLRQAIHFSPRLKSASEHPDDLRFWELAVNPGPVRHQQQKYSSRHSLMPVFRHFHHTGCAILWRNWQKTIAEHLKITKPGRKTWGMTTC